MRGQALAKRVAPATAGFEAAFARRPGRRPRRSARRVWRLAAVLVANALCWYGGAAADESTLRYVAEQGQDQGDCALSVRPCRTVQYALSVAGKTDEVRVARGAYEVRDLEDASYVVHGSVAVLGGFDRFDHFLTQAPDRNPTTLIGVPLEFRDALRAQGFHVIVDRKGLDRIQRAALGAISTSAADVACENRRAGAHACDSVDLLSHVALADMVARPRDGADVWGFVDLNTGREYALIGVANGLATFDVTDPRAPFEVGHVWGVGSVWRDVKVLQRFDAVAGRWRSHAYVSTDAGGQLRVIDLTGLPNRATLARTRSEHSIHNVYVSNVEPATGIPVDESAAPPLLYALGASATRGAFVAYDLADPLDPRRVSTSTGGYSHDAASMLAQGAPACGTPAERCPVLFDFNEDTFDLYDMSDAQAPRLLSSTTYEGAAYVHSGWPTEDGRHVFVHDELDELYGTGTGEVRTLVRVFDLADPGAPALATTWSGSTAAIDHNGYVRGNRYFMSNYARGLTVLDITSPADPVEVGYFDTYTIDDKTQFTGAWGVYPFLPSGNVLISDMAGGLYVLGDNTRVSEHGGIGFTAATFAGQEGSEVSVSVARTGGTAGQVSVDYALVPGSADATDLIASSGTLEWAAGRGGVRTITLPLVADEWSEPIESVLVRLVNPRGGAVLADTGMASVFIGDAGASPTVGFAETHIAVEEAAQRAIATVHRAGSPLGAVSVSYAVHAGTAAASDDYRSPSGDQLSWGDGDATPRTIVVPIVRDAVDEIAERFEVRLSSPSGAALGDAILGVTVNADVTGMALTSTSLRLRDGEKATYGVRLDTRPEGIVTVSLSANGDSDVAVTPAQLRFATADWSVAREVTVTAAPDSNGNGSVTIEHVASGGGYDSVTAALSVTVLDGSTPDQVTGLEVAGGLESLVVSWTAVTGADGYRIQWRSAGESYSDTDRQVTVSGGSTTSHTIAGLTPGTRYTVRVTAASSSAGDGEPSTERGGTPFAGPPGRVTGVEVTAGIERLVVSWLALTEADGYQVQWKSGDEAYDADRQHDVAAGPTTTYTIQGLAPGTEYTVRVKATRAHAIQDGAPSEEHRGTPRAPGVRVTEELPDRGLAVGDSVRVDVAANFRAPEGGRIEFDAQSADAAVAVVDVEGSVVTIRGVGHGVTLVTVTATDPGGAQATQTFEVAVGHEVSFEDTVLTVPEGDTARLTVAISRVRDLATTLAYTIGVDADPTTPDADALDRDGARGSVTIAAGEPMAMFAIAVHDDADIEAARETFAVTLEQSPEQIGDFAFGFATAWVRIAEGVCDRTAQVGDALRGAAPCTAVSDEDLAGRRVLELAGQGLAALRGRDLYGLTGLRALDLSENRLRALPGGVFAGLGSLRELQLQDNPGAPFRLTVELLRIDAEATAPGPATVLARLAEGAPFDMPMRASVVNGTLSATALVIPSGATVSSPVTVTGTGMGAAGMTLDRPPAVPNTLCGESDEYACFRGLTLALAGPLALFRGPAVLTRTVPKATLGIDGDVTRIDLSKLFAAAGGGALAYTVTSSAPTLVTATVAGTILTVVSNEDGEEGVAILTVTATDSDGLSVTLTIEAQIEFAPRGLMSRWLRVLTTELLPDPGEDPE